MNIMTPAQVASNRTARLVDEAQPILRYSTTTPERECLHVVEMEADTGYRTWSSPMVEGAIAAYVDSFPESYMLSDIDHSAKCWCQK